MKLLNKAAGGTCLTAFVLLTGCQSVQLADSAAVSRDAFRIERINPATMVNTELFGYTQIVSVEHARLIFIAGQGPTTLDGPTVAADDLRGQARNAVDNILLALDAVGAGPENIVNLRINVVDYNPRMLIDIAPELKRLSKDGVRPPASVFIGVSTLVLPSTLIEIETVAAVPVAN
jgi:enamine deaminase RidA (YjgF/YER057c/UK114 family)